MIVDYNCVRFTKHSTVPVVAGQVCCRRELACAKVTLVRFRNQAAVLAFKNVSTRVNCFLLIFRIIFFFWKSKARRRGKKQHFFFIFSIQAFRSRLNPSIFPILERKEKWARKPQKAEPFQVLGFQNVLLPRLNVRIRLKRFLHLCSANCIGS